MKYESIAEFADQNKDQCKIKEQQIKRKKISKPPGTKKGLLHLTLK